MGTAETLLSCSKSGEPGADNYLKIAVILMKASSSKPAITKLLEDHFIYPESIRLKELSIILEKINYLYAAEQTGQSLTPANALEAPEPAKPFKESHSATFPVSSNSDVTKKSKAHPPKTAGLLRVTSKSTGATPYCASPTEVSPQAIEDPPNTIRVSLPKKAPKVILRGTDGTKKLDVTKLTLLKRRELSNARICYSMNDSSGLVKLVSLRSLTPILDKVEALEHKILKTSSRKFASPALSEQRLLLKYIRQPQVKPKPQSGKIRILNEAEILDHTPHSYQDLEEQRCYVCLQSYPVKRIQCKRCKLCAHVWCLPDNDDLIQEWINEEIECHYCTEYKLFKAESIQKDFKVPFNTRFFDKAATFLVNCRAVFFKDSTSSKDGIVPDVWLKLTDSDLYATIQNS
ncbi:hypothetical protein DSO57_1015231 [Entomophthora muscae]|uniref:Uncharacterized protein n=1 Tax=Entomophthora muscae TaxID=34485 RepID=A0ACC2TSP9_9FUNG|nr:hypothetical protein DSO57_1015231 [Entomophthora muscae]